MLALFPCFCALAGKIFIPHPMPLPLILPAAPTALLLDQSRILGVPDPGDPIWLKLNGIPLLVLHSGRPYFDDALEEGLKEHWKIGPWRWVSDSEMSAKRPDSLVLVLRTIPITDWVQGPPFSATCPYGDRRVEGLCVSSDSGSIVRLDLVSPDGTTRILHAEVTELRTRPRLDGMVVDIPRDFQDILTLERPDSIPDPNLLSNTEDWRNIVLSRMRVETCYACTLFVAREYGASPTPEEMAKATGHPVRVLGADTLDQMLGTKAPGLYLEGSGKSQSWQVARVRTLDGEFLASSERGLVSPFGWTAHRPDSQIVLDESSFRILGHRLAGDEHRIAWDASAEFDYAASTSNLLGIGGVEIVRGVFATFGAGAAWNLTWTGSGSVPELEGGVRWFPNMGLEPNPFGWRAFLDLSVLQPLGDVSSYGMVWHPPTTVIAALTVRHVIWDFGVGIAKPLDHAIPGGVPMFFRLGLNIEGRLWKKNAPPVIVPRSQSGAGASVPVRR